MKWNFKCLNKYLFREREYKNVLKKSYSKNIYTVENEDCEPIIHKSCFFCEKKNLEYNFTMIAFNDV